MVSSAPAVRALRDGCTSDGYIEVETPMLQPIHGGATARPFKTHINAYDIDLYLRIATELYLKRSWWAGASEGLRGLTQTSVTRARTPLTTPSSRCSRLTVPTSTTTRWRT